MKNYVVPVLLMSAMGGSGAALADLPGDVDAYRAQHESEIVDQFAAFVAQKSVAANPEGVAATAHYLEGELKARGFEVKEFTGAPGVAPAVFGYLKVPKAKRTVVYYAHYDGQPVTPSQWSSDPFTPTLRAGASLKDESIDWHQHTPPFDPEWRLYGRATGDDKATIQAFLIAFDALKSLKRSPSVNVKVLWEGEEEAGSTHLATYLREHRDILKTDLWLIGDGPVHQSRKPQVYFGARGVIGVDVTLYGPNHALHDGHYGNWVPNPATEAANLIAAMRDDEGRILIPGFYDDVRAVTETEQLALNAMPPVDADLKREFGLGRTEGGQSWLTSLMRPALNVRGIRSGQVGDAAANAIPVDAEVSIDFRLVPNETPDRVRDLFEGFLKSKGYTLSSHPPDAEARLAHPKIAYLKWEEGYPALRSDMSSPAAKAVIAAANSGARQSVLVAPSLGGSVPLYMFDQLYHVPIVGIPIANHDDNQHAANENLRLKNLWDGIDTYASLLAELNW
jgi:acetylornithine deacetylase/succinyl-diaminopimelate desuccinylase-like protein